MKFKTTGAAASLALLLATVPAVAQNIEFALINGSSHTVTYFYASPSNNSSWGDDLLGPDGIIQPGEHGTVFIADGSDECFYDFRFETAEGAELEVAEIDICELGSYTLSD